MAERTCSIDGCEKPMFNVGRALCAMHYARVQRHGDPHKTLRRPPVRGGTTLERCMRLTEITEDGCWLWKGTISTNGYGRFAVNGTTRPAHRIIYEILVGPIPEGLTIDHLCRVRHCVRPDHLEPVTQYVNQSRGTSPVSINTNKTHCKRGHPFSEANTRWVRGKYRVCRACDAIRASAILERRRERLWREHG